MIFGLHLYDVKAETYVVTIGICNYKDKNITSLQKTERDAKDVANFYLNGTDKVISILGPSATKINILTTLYQVFTKASKNDKIVFYFSGHGYKGGFCPYDMLQLSDGISYKELIEIMNLSNASEKYILADACNCGALRAEENILLNNNETFVMFLSSRGSESSGESLLESNGFFTKYLLKGLRGGADDDRDRIITAKELFDYVSYNVKIRTRGKQNPVMWGKFEDTLPIVRYLHK